MGKTKKVIPENSKTAQVISFDEVKSNKNEILNFKEVSVPNVFSKFYERVI